MKFSVAWRPSVPASASPWRVLDERGREVAWANTFLDAQRVPRTYPLVYALRTL